MPNPETVVTISKHDDVDPVFAEVCDLLFGGLVDPREAYDISKFSDPSEMHVMAPMTPAKKRKRERRLATTGLGLGAVAGVAGGHGLYRTLSEGGEAKVLMQHPKKLMALAKTPKGKTALAAGAGWAGLHTAELGADALGIHANKKLLDRNKEKSQKKKKTTMALSKAYTDALADIVTARREGWINTETAIVMASELTEGIEKAVTPLGIPRSGRYWRGRALQAEHVMAMRPVGRKALVRGTIVAAGGLGGAAGYYAGKNKGRKLIEVIKDPKAKSKPKPPPVNIPAVTPLSRTVKDAEGKKDVHKAEQVDYAFTGEISKMDTDKRLAFGWCSLSEIDGEPVVDLQGDYAPIEEIEKSAYAYVKDSRVGGDMHAREGVAPRHTSDLVESFIATPEKLKQMGLSEEVAKSVPTGWWVGFKVNDDEQWAMVKDGRRAGFSIHGRGSRVQKALGS